MCATLQATSELLPIHMKVKFLTNAHASRDFEGDNATGSCLEKNVVLRMQLRKALLLQQSFPHTKKEELAVLLPKFGPTGFVQKTALANRKMFYQSNMTIRAWRTADAISVIIE